MSYEQVRVAAERRHDDDSSSTWKLADAILAEIPDNPSRGGGDRRSREAINTPRERSIDLDERLGALALRLDQDGIRTPDGDAYTGAALRHLRDTAMAWRPNTSRHTEAAYRTHQEAGSPTTGGGIMLDALCRYARGERVQRPEVTVGRGKTRRTPDQEAWAAAIAGVRRKRNLAKTPRYLVAANDLRAALMRLGNIPVPQRDQHAAVEQARTAAGQRMAEVVEDHGPEAAGRGLADASPEAATEAGLESLRDDLDTEGIELDDEYEFDPLASMANTSSHQVFTTAEAYKIAARALAEVLASYEVGADAVTDQSVAGALNENEATHAALRAALGLKPVSA